MKLIIDSAIKKGYDIQVDAVAVPRIGEYVTYLKNSDEEINGKVMQIEHEFSDETHTIYVHLD